MTSPSTRHPPPTNDAELGEGEDDMTIPSFHHDRSPGAMSRWTRRYLAVTAFRHLALGLFCLLAPWLFASAAFIPVLDFLPIWGWGSAMTVCGGLCGLSAALRSADLARWAEILSAMITVVLTAGVTIGIGMIWVQWAEGGRDVPASPVVPILLASLAAVDYFACSNWVGSPFEAVLRRVSAE
jgi:hypothetical protein